MSTRASVKRDFDDTIELALDRLGTWMRSQDELNWYSFVQFEVGYPRGLTWSTFDPLLHSLGIMSLFIVILSRGQSKAPRHEECLHTKRPMHSVSQTSSSIVRT